MENKKLGFGFMRLPLKDENDAKSVDTEMLCKMIDTFLERGFTYFDTAYMYHDFQSEVFLRECLVKRHKRDEFTVATKLPTMMLKAAEDCERIFNEQLEKCGVEFFDYYLLHNINVGTYAKCLKFGAFEFIKELKALIDKYLKKHDSISEQELYEKMGFPENWRKITRYRKQ